jgi:hypothetical protein
MASDRRLTFVLTAPGEDAARALARHLAWETNYDVHVLGPGTEDDSWRVAGATKPTDADAAAVEEWVAWLAEAGASFGGALERWAER